jgi:predicted AlkP superfamily pyrophosphatase or phosphodiesterase
VSIDALRVDHITTDTMPNLTGLIAEGVSTLNARTDPAYTRTLPNHTSQFTGRPVYGAFGHQVDFNEDAGTTVHSEAGQYISSVFDVVHDNGGRTVAYAGKTKFAMVDRNWNATNGAPDTTGHDDGTDKIDTYLLTDPSSAADLLLDDLANAADLEYAFFHIRYPDAAGHDFGWGSPEYLAAVEASDAVLGRIISAVESHPVLASTTSIIVVADHGGPIGQFLHGEAASAENYTIPFVVWGPGVMAGADLYDLNDTRVDPGGAQLGIEGVQPIRGHEVANLALLLLGYNAVPGSVFNASQDLRLS